MGNIVMTPPCFNYKPNSTNSHVRLIFWEGTTRVLIGNRHLAGEIMFEFPDSMVCHADSFFIGQPIPSLAIDDELMIGQTYFVLPLDRFSCNVLSASILSALVSSPKSSMTRPVNFKECPFEYIKSSNGRVLIKVMPEFMIKLLTRGNNNNNEEMIESSKTGEGFLCSTPELKKQYDQLVGAKDQIWSPKLETISEYNKTRYSPCRFIGLTWKEQESQYS